MKTIQLTIDEDLLARVSQVIEQEKTTLSAFIMESLVHYLNKRKIREMEKQHREGYDKHPVQKGEFDIWEDEQVWVS
ncbi:MAG: CopG family transcriptional regulator [candidate division KSB1 bacterium]|nr:CopG family transcriptional regulator [candidate division KSB1 bacterium]MDZ7304421.1 CopG family transcriptional regulator [candidate division KSB1 bacterium]MDZ7313371.1 CopG family transcriptional regulator [candidate division KSB1 bacterium]